MLKYSWVVIICLIFMPTPLFADSDQAQIPPESLKNLQDIFTDLRDRLWEKNDDFWHRGEHDRCIATMRLITQIDPYDIEAYDDAAWLMQNSFHDDEAEAFLKEGLRNNPDIYDLYFALGYFYYMHVRFDEAIPYMEAATAFECPDFIRNQLAHAYEHAGYPGTALGIWTETEYSEPGYLVAWNQINRILQGGPPVQTPETMNKWRLERKKSEGR